MSAYQVAVVEDDAAPTSGVAIIRIAGLEAWPQGATVRLRPIDEASVPPQSDGWPWGELVPSRVIPKSGGIDVILGPDVVSSHRLVPGTPVTIEVSAANVEADVRWPAITPTAPRRVSAVAMSATQLLAAKSERERVEKEAATRRQQMAESAALSVREAAAEASSVRVALAVAAPVASKEAGQLARLFPVRRANAVLTAEQKVDGQLSRLGSAVERAATNAEPTPRPVARGRASAAITSFIAGAVTMAGVAAGVALLAPQWLPRAPVAPAAALGAQMSVVNLESVFKDLGSAGPTSPRRKSATNVDLPTALSLADHSLRGQRTSAETEEAEFWLKRALNASFGGTDVGWALTQLGTIYAQSDSPRHSYAKAHTVWQLAAAQGDPVAHCFLGAIYEHGLGVTANRQIARGHYVIADTANACRSAKEAAARLKD